MADFTWVPTQAPSIETFLGFELQPIPVIPVLAGIIALFYIIGWIRLAVQGRRWPVWRGILFLLGCLLLAAVMGLAIEGYGQVMFSVFMFQQMTLMMAVPPLLLLGAPGTLLLRSSPRNLPGRIVLKLAIFGLRSWVGKVVVHPLFSIPLFLVLFYGLYLSNAANFVLSSGIGGHIGLELVFLFTGIIFNATLIPADPLPVPESHVVRIFHSFLEAGLHAFFGVIVMMATLPLVDRFTQMPASWGIDVMEDQKLAGGIAWAYGEGPAVAILLVVLITWSRQESKNNASRDREVALHGDKDLDAYNEYLRALNRGEITI
ncbi:MULTISPECIES: cytochrome c oxidase assembly protein [Brevibacterium]|uniref:Cytochrome c oxidase assembly protein n=1 Tax=Brevibacterium aurantiacum TaxID=273384 RepID=A0A2A3ZL42_BREAU|nr:MULTISPECIES: cytochrome c oxidase assembly protein [Brevibacterium]PCC52702.1 cytochrome c oxidase assembly protein [Brevibacterium aurantiacum]WCE40699.1 cytochrome c oxidase assembly protein [Brevibacterium sp. BDJS002]